MSEEIRNPGMELNDAALEGVSGGETDEALIQGVEHFCGRCSKRGSCRGSVEELAAYIMSHGPVAQYTDCPFRK